MHAAAPRPLGAVTAGVGNAGDDSPDGAPGNPATGAATTMPVLSLFLLLLALFVMLTGIANFEERRTAAVMGSLDATFRAADAGATRTLGSLAGPLIGAERLEERLHELVATDFPLQPVALSRLGTTVLVELPADAVFEPQGDRPRAAVRELLARLAGLLAEPPRGLAYETIVALAPRDGAWRAAAVARALAAAGAPAERLAAALIPAADGTLRLSIETLTKGGGK